MRKKSMFTKSVAFIMAAAVAIVSVGCGTKGQTGESNKTQADITEEGSSEAAQEDNTGSSGMGRYVEKTVFESDYYDTVSTQTLSDGSIVFMNAMNKEKLISKDGGETWENEASDDFADFAEEHYPAATAVAKDGTLAVVVMDVIDGTDDYNYNLYIYNTDNTYRQVPIEQLEAGIYIRRITFDEQDNLYVFASKAIYRVDINEGSAEKLTDLQDSCDVMECKNNVLMCMTYEKIYLYDLEKRSFIEDEVLDDFIKETYNGMSFTGSGYTAYAFMGEDNTVYIAGPKGLYRHVIGGGTIEQVIDGGLSALGSPSHLVSGMTMNDKNEFLTAYSDGKIVKFTYDATVPTVPNDKLTVYSLSDDDMVRQTITAFQTQNPNMYIEYQVGMDEGGVTREDALKKLNTQILGGSGPDVIMLDSMNINTYAEKGVLMDLTDIVNEADKNEGLYMNMIKSMQPDDKIYAVPTIFAVPVVLGQKDMVDSISDYKSLADMVEKAREEYPDTTLIGGYSAKGILRHSVPVCAPSWKDDKGGLDVQKIREFLEQTKRIYDAQMKGIPKEYIIMYQQNLTDEDGTSYEDNKYFTLANETSYLMKETPLVYGEMLTSYTYKSLLSAPRVEGFEGTLLKPLNGQSSNVYHPLSIAGVNAATKMPDEAKQFVGIMLGTTVQGTMEFGIPVNKKALAAAYEYDESELSETGAQSSVVQSYGDGTTFGYDIFPVNQDGIDNLEKWIAGLDTPYLTDVVLEEAVYKEGAKYFEGQQDIDKAVKAISDSVEIYLYE